MDWRTLLLAAEEVLVVEPTHRHEADIYARIRLPGAKAGAEHEFLDGMQRAIVCCCSRRLVRTADCTRILAD